MGTNTTAASCAAEVRLTELQCAFASRLARLIGAAEKQATAIHALTLHQRRAPTGDCHVTYEPGLIVVAQGRKEVQIGKDVVSYDAGRYLLTCVDLPTVTRVAQASMAKPCLAASLKIDVSMVREFLGRDEFHSSAVAADSPGIAVSPVTAELLSALCRLLDLLSSPADIPFLSGLIEREIMYRVLCSPDGARLRAIATVGDRSHRTTKAIAWIRTNYAKPLLVEELAEVAGMAVSTLHHHFRALTAMSPLQFQKQIRLQAARARMLADDVDAATVAFETGYESASQFNREYSRMFGQPPARDVRNLRSTAATASEAVTMAQSAI